LLCELLADLKTSHMRHVGEIRQCGFIAGIDILADAKAGRSYAWTEQMGHRICRAARRHGLLTRPVGDTVVLMPPFCITEVQLRTAVSALAAGVEEVCRN